MDALRHGRVRIFRFENPLRFSILTASKAQLFRGERIFVHFPVMRSACRIFRPCIPLAVQLMAEHPSLQPILLAFVHLLSARKSAASLVRTDALLLCRDTGEG